MKSSSLLPFFLLGNDPFFYDALSCTVQAMHLFYRFFAMLSVLTCVLAVPLSSAAAETPLARKLNQILKLPALAQAKTSLYVVDLDTGEELFAHEPNALLIPASNVKLITTAAALHYLSADYQFSTEIYGALDENGRVTGDLGIYGEGDPFLVPERVWYMASRLALLGVREISGDLIVDDSYFSGDRMAYGKEQDHSSHAYMAPSGAVSVGFNALMVSLMPGLKPGQLARVHLDPSNLATKITGEVKTIDSGHAHVDISVVSEGTKSHVLVRGAMKMGDKEKQVWRRVENPPVFAGEAFRSALLQHGVTLKGSVRAASFRKNDPEYPRLLCTVSPRLGELVAPLNKYSSNFMATQVALALGAKKLGAPGTWDKTHAVLEGFLKDELGIAPGTYTLGNASGLHNVNRLTTQQLVRVLAFVRERPEIFYEFVSSLAVAGGAGTLQDRMHNSPAHHRVRAKTGTLAEASALSGYVMVSPKKTWAFSLLVNHYRHVREVWAAQDQVASALAQASLDALGEKGAVLQASKGLATSAGSVK